MKYGLLSADTEQVITGYLEIEVADQDEALRASPKIDLPCPLVESRPAT